MSKHKRIHNKPSVSDVSPISQQIERMKTEGYAVMPASITSGNFDSAAFPGILNFASSSQNCTCAHDHGAIHNPLRTSGHFTSTAPAVPTPDDIGTPGKGYIPYGAYNNLPNAVSLANSLLIYTAKALEFNVDTLCGLGVEPVYRFHNTIGCNENDEEIAYEHAGSYIQQRIQKLRKELFNLLKDHDATPAYFSQSSTSAQPAQPGEPGTVPDGFPSVSPHIITPSPKQTIPSTPVIEDPEDEPADDPVVDISALHAPDGLGYRRHADTILDDIIRQYHAEIARLERDYKVWGRTNARLREFQRRTNQTRLSHGLATDMASFYLCFPELLLDGQGSKQPDSARWKPKIIGINYRDLLSTRFEEKDDFGVSRFVYVSNTWLDTLHRTIPTGKDTSESGAPEFASEHDDSIGAIPALDPLCAVDDLNDRIRHFRAGAQSLRARIENAKAAGDEALVAELEQQMQSYAPSSRPCRFVLPTDYHTSGRHYYPLPPYWAIFQDIYLYAANIIRDRSIRKENENMFTYVLYVHTSYLDRLTNQIDAQKTEKEKEAIRQKAVQDIKDFLSNKQNNGSTLAACTFTGPDGKDHDAFRVERIDFANQKSTADGNRLELSDISGLIMFAFSCHPDLIGSTPGGASSSGGTYQREMLLIKQSMVAHMQSLLLYPWFVTRDFNKWDSHLSFRIKQRVLTTLDASKTGLTEE